MDKKQKYINFILLLGALILLRPFLAVLFFPDGFISTKAAMNLNIFEALSLYFIKQPHVYFNYVIGGLLLGLGIYLDKNW